MVILKDFPEWEKFIKLIRAGQKPVITYELKKELEIINTTLFLETCKQIEDGEE